MRSIRMTSAVTLLTLSLMAGPAGFRAAQASPAAHVVTGAGIQERIDRQMSEDGARQDAIRSLLQRPEVRRVAGAAGLDLSAATASVALLSGAELQDAAARAADIDARLGGDSVVIISSTALIIILLIILILAD